MLYHFPSIDSTNSYLLRTVEAEPTLTSGTACLADTQTAGRGRANKPWLSPAGSGVWLSMVWQFPNQLTSQLPPLSLVIAVATRNALIEHALGQAIQFKWPNDLYLNHKKLGGILIETTPSTSEHIAAVIGLGLNLHLPADTQQHSDQPITDLAALEHPLPATKVLAETILQHWQAACSDFCDKGFAPWQTQWQNADMCWQQPVCFSTDAGETFTGTAQGIDAHGRLQLEDANRNLQTVAQGHLRLL